MDYLSDEELMKAAMGDLADDDPPKATQPQMPLRPPKPQYPQPPQPPQPQHSPQTPQYMPQTDISAETKKKKKGKIFAIVAVIAIVLIAGIVLLLSGGSGGSSGGGYYYDDNDNYYDDTNTGYEEPDNTYEDGAEENGSILFSMNPFDAIEYVLIDNTVDKFEIHLYPQYNEHFGEYTVRTCDDKVNPQILQVVDKSKNEIAQVYFDCDVSSYKSTGAVTVFIENAVNEDIYLLETTKDFVPLTCDYLLDFNSIPQGDFDTLRNNAVDQCRKEQPDIEYVCAYFGCDSNGSGGSVFSSNNNNILSFIFKYEDEYGTSYMPCTYGDLKQLSDGSIKDVEKLEGTIKDSFDSLSDAKDEGDFWETFSKVD